MTNEKLKHWQLLITIFAAIAVPVLVAFFGWQIQRGVSSQQINRDYVTMAVEILKREPTAQDAGLRQWAVKVINDTSPIPFSMKVQEQLLQKERLVIQEVKVPIPFKAKLPPEIVNAIKVDLPEFISPEDPEDRRAAQLEKRRVFVNPAATSALDAEGERRLKTMLLMLTNRLEAIRKWNEAN